LRRSFSADSDGQPDSTTRLPDHLQASVRSQTMSKNVKVEARPSERGLIDWEIDGMKAKDSKIEFKKGDSSVTVEFKLKDTTNRELRFDEQAPIWVHENERGQCPPEGATDAQIEIVSCGGDTLTLINRNEKECTLRYQLNFLDKANRDETCDPEFKNGGTNLL
jgi:hypothetical protein